MKLSHIIASVTAAVLTGLTMNHAQAQSGSGLERGRYLVEHVAACGVCHYPRNRGQPLRDKGLSGGLRIETEAYLAYSGNITPDPETGIGSWTDAQLGRAIREGVRPDGSIIGPAMPLYLLRTLGDDDLAAIIAYLRAQPPVNNAVQKSTYKKPLPANYGPSLGSVMAPAKADKVRYGKYIVDLAHCMECHTTRNAQGDLDEHLVGAGGQSLTGGWGTSVSRNLTPHESGLKDWSDADIAKSIRTGRNRDGQPYRPPMGFEFYSGMNDEDISALIAYLRSLPSQPFAGGR